MSEIYLSINEENLNKVRANAKETAISIYGESDESKTHLLFESLDWITPQREITFEEGELTISGNYSEGKNNLGYMSIQTVLDMDTIINIIEYYVSKINKVKTILEATK